MTNCQNGLGECKEQFCILETCQALKDYKLTRLQEETFRKFWVMIEFEAYVDELFALFDKPMPTLYLYEAGCLNLQLKKEEK